MAEITASMVKELRERTQAGMVDCKNALKEADGNMASAVEILQKKFGNKLTKSAGKIAADGLVASAVSADGRTGVAVELNCQTDFVARGDDFKGVLRQLTAQALAHKTADVASLEAVSVDGKTFKELIDGLTVRSGEKHALRRVALFTAGDSSRLQTYVHSNGRIAVLVEVSSSNPTDARVVDFADDVCLQVASMSPQYLKKSDVPQDVIAKQREIFSALMDKEDAEIVNEPDAFIARVRAMLQEAAAEEGRTIEDLDGETEKSLVENEKIRASLDGYRKAAEKIKARPAATREKILDGKVSKWLTEVVLLDQTSVKESNKTIAKVESEVASQVKGTAVARFIRFEVGEGIEKAATKDFATEVAEMAAGAR